MAGERNHKSSKIEISYKKGRDDKGNDIIKKISFSGIDISATDDNLYKFADAVANALNFESTKLAVREVAKISEVTE